MKKVVLNLSAFDYGGAGKFTLHFNDLLRKTDCNTYLVVMDVKTSYPHLIPYPKGLEKPIAKLQRKLAKQQYTESDTANDYYFYTLYDRFSTITAGKILALLPVKPDVIIVHWVSDFINAETLHELQKRSGAKVYILMLDNAPITGGCHYPWDCAGFETDCSGCPAMLKASIKAIPKKNLALKKQYLPDDVTLLVFSDNDLKRARNSALFKHKSIIKLPGYLVDETKYRPGNQSDAKAFFNIDEKQRVVFFGATSLVEKRKGMHLLINALEHIEAKNVTYLVAGSAPLSEERPQFKLVGNLTEEQLIKAYQAADLFVCPTLEDSGPTMINQAVMCGTPVVSFETGIGGDLVYTGKTGYRAKHNDSQDLAAGINYLLNLSECELQQLRQDSRNFVINMYGGNESYLERMSQLIQT
ncbi:MULTISPECIES: glycosyltransferase [Spirosoma]|uniref:Glycosyltransferase n=1 Tax=Spirosoma liriopis TaxID=2937440 RepID=A0ABT0HRT9_9BACT|nr:MULTISPECIES: glycosyltransferase [Spirosoma]MCK8494893.1 glycosyltransferase [Spirosoma liriopis]UHG94037.1 glycosyltransferase [Spirosoma oryzicola]